MFLANVPAISIMKITGHRTEKAFMKYIKITQDLNPVILLLYYLHFIDQLLRSCKLTDDKKAISDIRKIFFG